MNHQAPLSLCESLVARLGARIKLLRTSADLTGRDLAEASGVSRSMLSRIERGQVSPSVDTLGRIAEGLGVPITRLFPDQAEPTEFSLVRKGRGAKAERRGAERTYREELLGNLPARSMQVEPHLVRIGAGSGPCPTPAHQGSKFVHLLSGRVRFRCGASVMAFNAGDSLLFDANAPHGVEEVMQGPVSYLSVLLSTRS